MVGAIVVVVAGVLVVVSGGLGWAGKLHRNRFAGVRTASTMRSEQAFTVGNRVAGPVVTLGGLAAVVAGVVGLVQGDKADGVVLAGVLVMGVLVILGGVLGSRAASRVGS
ncbi:SdpI family protein [Actinoplanes sp. KI2]|uniref:SdpI family protein n=1 Tax=Actinoplanes sp. KI2 TaxID=2983315 RepID=UPI0021D5BF1F|nr:SdpI family protein [Actinoplanes sp. KI2]MCU7722571.1 SdpI family protein [Actinoplanes sp. KI2]